MTHSLKFLFTGSFGVPAWPEFVGVTMVDEVEVVYYDSNIRRAEPKQDWMKKIMEDDAKHTDEFRVSYSFFNATIKNLMQSFNQTGGILMFHFFLLKYFYCSLLCCKQM